VSDRRRNLFILLLVAGLIAASAAVLVAKQTRLGLDLQGGVELVYQGKPTPQQPKVTQEALDRALSIVRKRVDQLGALLGRERAEQVGELGIVERQGKRPRPRRIAGGERVRHRRDDRRIESHLVARRDRFSGAGRGGFAHRGVSRAWRRRRRGPAPRRRTAPSC